MVNMPQYSMKILFKMPISPILYYSLCIVPILTLLLGHVIKLLECLGKPLVIKKLNSFSVDDQVHYSLTHVDMKGNVIWVGINGMYFNGEKIKSKHLDNAQNMDITIGEGFVFWRVDN
jgi:hypothetical protein